MRADRGATLLVTVALVALISLSTSALAHLGGLLLDHSRVRTAAEAAALAAVVWQVVPEGGAELTDLLARYGAELVSLEVHAPHDAMSDLEVAAAEVTLRRGRAQATARAMARETPLPTMAP